MAGQKKSPFSLSIDALEQELMARSAQLPAERLFHFKDPEGTPTRQHIMQGVKKRQQSPLSLNSALADIETWDLAKILVFKTRPGMDSTRGNASEDILDYFELSDPHTLYNTQSIAALCQKGDFLVTGENQFSLKTKPYGKTFNLCELEPFRDQPICTGTMGTAFLVAENMMATAASLLQEKNMADLRLLFGYAMTDLSAPSLTFTTENIYHVINIIPQDPPSAADWVLLQLDRPVTGYKKVKPTTTPPCFDQEIYILGHPLGLPLKYAAGASISETQTAHFTANLSAYSANPGSPVFDQNSHQLIGMVVGTETPDFIWTGNGWMSINTSEGKQITCAIIPASLHNLP